MKALDLFNRGLLNECYKETRRYGRILSDCTIETYRGEERILSIEHAGIVWIFTVWRGEVVEAGHE